MPALLQELRLIRNIEEDVAEALQALNKDEMIVVRSCLEDVQRGAALLHQLLVTLACITEAS